MSRVSSAVVETLETHNISVHFEGVTALDAIDLELRRDEVLGLIGPNGAGKTTLVNVVTGFQLPEGGRILLSGQDVTGWAAAFDKPSRGRADVSGRPSVQGNANRRER